MRIIRQCKYKKIRQAFYKLAGFFYFSQIFCLDTQRFLYCFNFFHCISVSACIALRTSHFTLYLHIELNLRFST